MNYRGHPETLRARQPGNVNAVKAGVYSPRILQPRGREVAAALLAAPHTVPLDQIAAEEIGSLVALIEAIDSDLVAHGLTNRRGEARTLLDYRSRLSGRLERWLKEFGATPASRAEWVERITRAESVSRLIRSDLAEGGRLVEEARARGDFRPTRPTGGQR
jgi:hypothetical protein